MRIDKTPTLLLCSSPNQLTAKKTLSENTEFEMRRQRTQILNTKDFRKYLRKYHIFEDYNYRSILTAFFVPIADIRHRQNRRRRHHQGNESRLDAARRQETRGYAQSAGIGKAFGWFHVFGRQMERSFCAGTGENVRFHVVRTANVRHWIDQNGTVGCVPAHATATVACGLLAGRCVFVGAGAALSAGERDRARSDQVQQIAGGQVCVAEFADGSAGRSGISAGIPAEWVSAVTVLYWRLLWLMSVCVCVFPIAYRLQCSVDSGGSGAKRWNATQLQGWDLGVCDDAVGDFRTWSNANRAIRKWILLYKILENLHQTSIDYWIEYKSLGAVIGHFGEFGLEYDFDLFQWTKCAINQLYKLINWNQFLIKKHNVQKFSAFGQATQLFHYIKSNLSSYIIYFQFSSHLILEPSFSDKQKLYKNQGVWATIRQLRYRYCYTSRDIFTYWRYPLQTHSKVHKDDPHVTFDGQTINYMRTELGKAFEKNAPKSRILSIIRIIGELPIFPIKYRNSRIGISIMYAYTPNSEWHLY